MTTTAPITSTIPAAGGDTERTEAGTLLRHMHHLRRGRPKPPDDPARTTPMFDTDAVSVATMKDGATTRSWRGLVLVCLAGLLWGTIGPAVQLIHTGSSLSPPTICAYRAIAAVGGLTAAVLTTGRLSGCLSMARRHWRRLTFWAC